MENKTRELDFDVTICLGCGDGGDVVVTVPVTDEEYEFLKVAYREDMGVEDYDELADLYERIKEEARAENDYCSVDLRDGDDDEEEDEDYYDEMEDASFIIHLPDEIAEAVETEDEEKDEEENDDEEDDE